MELTIIGIFILIGVLGNKFCEAFINRVLRYFKDLGHSPKKGRKLQMTLKDFFGQGGGSNLLPQYKFFHPLCFDLRSLQLSHGISSSAIMKILRPWLIKDVQFEEKLQSILKNSVAQFAILALFTWVFYLNARFSLKISSHWEIFTLLQISGIISFLYFYKKKKNRFFESIESLFQRVFMFRSLKSVGISMGEVLSRSQADQVLEVKDKDVRKQAELLLQICQRWTREGANIESDLEELVEELSYLRGERRRQFEVSLAGLRFIHLVFFYLFGYFLVILELIRQLASSY